MPLPKRYFFVVDDFSSLPRYVWWVPCFPVGGCSQLGVWNRSRQKLSAEEEALFLWAVEKHPNSGLFGSYTEMFWMFFLYNCHRWLKLKGLLNIPLFWESLLASQENCCWCCCCWGCCCWGCCCCCCCRCRCRCSLLKWSEWLQHTHTLGWLKHNSIWLYKLLHDLCCQM